MMNPPSPPQVSPGWISPLAIYLSLVTALNLIWEVFQLPFYTIWSESPISVSLTAAAHCTLGDFIIASWTIMLAILLVGRHWPRQKFIEVAVATMVLAVIYTIFSEWLNVNVRRSWAYSPLMPTLPWIDTGVAPLLQWVVTPMLSFFILGRVARDNISK